MFQSDFAWLAGNFDTRGSISVTQSSNVISIVALRFPTRELALHACELLASVGIISPPVNGIHRTHVLNYSAVRATKLLVLLIPHMRNSKLCKRAELHCEIFPLDSEGKHMKQERLNGYVRWLQLLGDEENRSEHD